MASELGWQLNVERIYLDHNAGAPLRPQAQAAIARLLGAAAGNPASVHHAGQRARRALETGRAQTAGLIGASPREVVFTSGGTESNNLAIFGAANSLPTRRRIVTTAIEHSSVLAPVAELEGRGYEVVRIGCDGDGLISPRDVAAAVDRNTALVTIGLANSETGAIQNVSALGAAAREAGALLHIDAAQAVGRIAVNVRELGCDLMTVSGHKLGAPAGIGALYIRDGVAIAPLIVGGPHERGLRAGTPNTLGAVAMGAAAAASACLLDEESERVAALASLMLPSLHGSIPGLALNGPRDARLPGALNLTFPGVLGESMLIALDLEGVEVSMGSACAAGSVEPSHVLLAMGRIAAQARSSLRISLGWNTTREEVELACEIIARVWRRVAQAEPATREARAAS